MRAPSFYADPRLIDPRGANLPAALERLRRSESKPGQVYAELANRLSALIDDIYEVRIKDDERTETLTLEVRGRDGVFHPASSLSDGTLRFLVLASLGLDPEARGGGRPQEIAQGMPGPASEKVGRRLRQFERDLPERAQRVSELITDFSPLRQLPAFRELERDAGEALSSLSS